MRGRKTSPVTVELHHEVLRPWAALRRTLGRPPRILSLDFHTDTLSALRRGVPAPDPEAWRDAAAVGQAVRTLHHDEHFDWALRAGIAARIALLAVSPQNGAPPPGIAVFPIPGLTPDAVLNAPETVRGAADGVLADTAFPPEVRAEFPGGTPFILDLDCDVFLTARSFVFAPDGFFARLVREAALVTLARESDWVKLLRLPGEAITGELIAERLTEKIAGTR